MIVLTVQGIPDGFPTSGLEDYWRVLKWTASRCRGFGSKESQTAVFFLRDGLQEGLGEEIIISIGGLSSLNQLGGVLTSYTEELGQFTKMFFPNSWVEIYLSPAKCLVWTSMPEKD